MAFPPSGRRVTIHDVAARTGVSQPTASLVLSHPPRARHQHLDVLRARQIDGVLLDAVGASTLPDEALAGVNIVLRMPETADVLSVRTS